jgi:hypothetical protein
MRWLKHTISLLMLGAAAAIAVATAFSDHSGDYGQVPLPQGGVVHLPTGKVTVFYGQPGAGSGSVSNVSSPLAFQVVPVGGGTPVPVSADSGAQLALADQGSQAIGEIGAVGKLDVPSAGDYTVIGSADVPAASYFLKFGTNAGAAVLHRWRLLAALVLGAILIALIPTPRPKRRWKDDSGASTGWSADSRAPYAG